MSQVALAARLAPQELDEMAKSLALAPVMGLPVMVMADDPLFLSATIRELLVWPTTKPPNEMLDGDAVAVPAVELAPAPERVTDCGLLLPLSVKVRVAVRVPVVAGAKVMLTVQLVDAASEDPQVVEDCAKSPGSAP